MPVMRMRIAGVVELDVSEEHFEWFEMKERILRDRRGAVKLVFGMAPCGLPYIENDFTQLDVRIERGLD